MKLQFHSNGVGKLLVKRRKEHESGSKSNERVGELI